METKCPVPMAAAVQPGTEIQREERRGGFDVASYLTCLSHCSARRHTDRGWAWSADEQAVLSAKQVFNKLFP